MMVASSAFVLVGVDEDVEGKTAEYNEIKEFSAVKSYQKISNNEGNFTGVLDYYDVFGRGVASLGDLDGDGITDVAVGSPLDDDGGDRRGAVWILFLESDKSVKSHQKISDTQGGFNGIITDQDYFGSSVACIGDLDGDNVKDIAVGARGDWNGCGAVWILFLNSDGTVKSHQEISIMAGGFTGILDYNDYFGWSITSMDDLDGDNITDIAVGAVRDDDDTGGQNERGAVWILFLNTDGTVKSHQKISELEGGFNADLGFQNYFGSSVANIGDLDGDGTQDIGVGADGYYNSRGSLWILFLNPNGTVKYQQWIYSNEGGFTYVLQDHQGFGSSICLLNDTNGDGVQDIAVGANGDWGGSYYGSVWFLCLNTNGTVKHQQEISGGKGGFTGSLSAGDRFGRSVSNLGDFDGDGVQDIVVGADADDDGNTQAGAIWILLLSTARQPGILLITPSNNSIIHSSTVLDFRISDVDLNNINYSIDGGGRINFLDPYDISTSGWIEGEHIIDIQANDSLGFESRKSFNFTIDDTCPLITLNSPANNSILTTGTVVDLDVSDIHLNEVLYKVNNGPNQNLITPYDIDMTAWSDDIYTIEVQAIDKAGNTAIEICAFTIDSTEPLITLNSPVNNSVISAGTILDFEVFDLTLGVVNYSINGGVNVSFPEPYDIGTTGWSEATYTVEVHANESFGRESSKSFNFTVDNTLPLIILNSPSNNSIINVGTIIDLDVTDIHLDEVNYVVNEAPSQILNPPYDIDTTGWLDGSKIIEVNAIDEAGNHAVETYVFTIDSTAPIITLNTPSNNSVISTGLIIDFDIMDPHLNEVNYTINAGPILTFNSPFDIDTTGWADGPYQIDLYAEDVVDHLNHEYFTFNIDSTNPIAVDISDVANPMNSLNYSDVFANITDNHGIGDVDLWYSLDGFVWNSVSMSQIAGTATAGTFRGTIPQVIFETTVFYYAEVNDLASNSATSISKSFNTNNPPDIMDVSHAPALPNGTANVLVSANISDSDGLNLVNLYYHNGSWQTVPMTWVSGDRYEATIPAINDNVTIFYNFETIDNIGMRNITTNYGYNIDAEIPFIGIPQIDLEYPNVHSFVNVSLPVLDNRSGIDKTTLWYSTDNMGNWTDVPMGDRIFYETFDSTTIGLNWESWVNSPTINTLGINEPSPPYSLELDGSDDVITSKVINTSSFKNMHFKFSYQLGGGGNAPEATDDLYWEFLNESGTWILLWVGPGDGTNHNTFNDIDLNLAFRDDAYHDNFQFRFRSDGSNQWSDDFYVDDIEITAENYWVGTIPPTGFGVEKVYYYVHTQDMALNVNTTDIYNYTVYIPPEIQNITVIPSPTNNMEDKTIFMNVSGDWAIVNATLYYNYSGQPINVVPMSLVSGNSSEAMYSAIILSPPFDTHIYYYATVEDISEATNTTQVYHYTSNPPIAEAGPSQTVPQNTLVQFDGTASYDDVDIFTHQWTFYINGSSNGTMIFTIVNNSNPTYLFTNIASNFIVLNVTDYSGQWDTDVMWVNVTDGIKPVSNIDNSLFAEITIPNYGIFFNATDNVELDLITLYYRFSTDNYTWGTKAEFSNITLSGNKSSGVFSFNCPEGEGYYQFLTAATDTAGNTESHPFPYDSSLHYDNTRPRIISIEVDPSSPITIDYFELTIIFDEFMNQSHQPLVSFGETGPYEIYNLIGDWVTAYTWVGNFNVTLIGDGTYTLKITDAKDLIGFKMDENTSYTFTIDRTSPEVLSHSPTGSGVFPGTNITIVFDETMNQSSVENAFGIVGINNSYSFIWNLDSTQLTVSINPNLDENITYQVNILSTATDIAGNNFDEFNFTFSTWLDTDDDGSPDFQDADDDNDGTPDIDDDFPLDPDEDTDTDGDGTGNNADTDDDNDGFIDEWEEYLGTNSTDENDTPLDTDNDGIPDGDTNNTEAWMDTDDDGDGVPDDIDADPLDPEITDIIDDVSDIVSDDGDSNYLWLIIILVLAILGALLLFRRKPTSTLIDEEIPPIEEEAVELETELCPSCGFEIEPGQPCPFCPAEPVVEPTIEPEPEQPAPPHPNQKMLDRIEKAYKDGKMSEDNYLKNLEKFK